MEQSAFAPIQITYENRLTYQTFHKMSALWEHAFEEDNLETVDFIMGSPRWVEIARDYHRNQELNLALYNAITKKGSANYEQIRMLLEHGAAPSYYDELGNCTLHYVAYAPEEVRELLWSREEFRPLYCWISRTFLTPIGWAITKNQWYFKEDIQAFNPVGLLIQWILASHEDRTQEEKEEEIKMLITINFNSINDSIMAINQVRNWGINKYNDPIKEKRININIPMLGMILTNCIKQLHQQILEDQ